MSQVQTIIVRKGLSVDAPALHEAELGYDTDTKTFRVGDDTPFPSKVITTKSTGEFNFSQADLILGNVSIATGKTFSGIDLNSLSANNGILVSKGSGDFSHVSLGSSNNTIDISNKSGVSGSVIDIKLSNDVLNQLTGATYLQSVASNGSFTGDGRVGSPLTLSQATNILLGGVLLSNATKMNAGTDTNSVITPSLLANITPASPMANALSASLGGTFAVSSDNSITGSGEASNPLSVAQATITQKGGARLATQGNVDAGIGTTEVITPNHLLNLSASGQVARNLRSVFDSGVDWKFTSLPTNGSVQTLPSDTSELIVTVQCEVDSTYGDNYDSFVEFSTELVIEVRLDNNWVQIGETAIAYASYGPISGVDRPSNDKNKFTTIVCRFDKDSVINRAIHSTGEVVGAWDNTIRAVISLNGSGTVGGFVPGLGNVTALPSSNSGYAIASLLYR